MKMIIAINNKNIEEKITNKYYSKYEIYIASSNDMVLKLSQYDKESIVILRDNLKGSIGFKELIVKLKELNSKMQIIVLVSNLTKEIKEMLFSKEVFSVLEGKRIIFDELEELIENPKMVIYKERKIDRKKSNVICITGGRGTGKTITAIILGRLIAKIKKKKVLIVDMDFVYPTMDTYLNINKNYSLVDYINDLINDKLKNIENYESKDFEYMNLRYILNSKSIGIPNNEIIIKLINSLKKKYDYIIIDTSSLMINKIYKIAIKEKYNIIYVIEPGERAIKNYKMDTIYLDSDMMSKSIIICNKCDVFNNMKKCSQRYKVKILGIINYSYLIKYNSKLVKYKLSYNFKKVLKELGINKFENLKLKIAEKVLGIEEEKK